MSIFLFLASLIILVAAYKGTQEDLFAVLKDDFTGSGNFVYWVLAIVLIVAAGNIKALKRFSDGFLVLVILGIVLSQYKRTNLLQSFIDQVRQGTQGSSSNSVKVSANLPSLDLGLGNMERYMG